MNEMCVSVDNRVWDGVGNEVNVGLSVVVLELE
jgi:hypothetical protein